MQPARPSRGCDEALRLRRAPQGAVRATGARWPAAQHTVAMKLGGVATALVVEDAEVANHGLQKAGDGHVACKVTTERERDSARSRMASRSRGQG